jgi:hypothetical protein
MLPAFDNIVRLTDHGEASYMNASVFEIVGVNAWGDLECKPRNGMRTTSAFASSEVINKGILALFAK